MSRLAKGEVHTFAETPDAAESHEIAALLGAQSVKKMRIEGTLHPFGKAGWMLKGQLGATVVQSCVVTLEPVQTRIDVKVTRRYLPGLEPLADGIELGPEDDLEIEELPEVLDLGALAAEELALALPDYPRAPGAVLPTEAHVDDPEEDARENPFAVLEALKDKMERPEE